MKFDVDGWLSPISHNILGHVLCARRHWEFHISSAPTVPSEIRMQILDKLGSFLTKRLLVWYEELSLMNRLEVASAALLMVPFVVSGSFEHCVCCIWLT